MTDERNVRNYEVKIKSPGNYYVGRFCVPKDPIGEIVIKSPADLNDIVGRFPYSYQDVDSAVASAREGFESWRFTSQATRVEYLIKYRDALKRMEARLAEVMAREVGKPLWEAKQEVATMINKVDATIGEGLLRVADQEIVNILPETRGITRFRPHGVFVVLGPFNFPGHLANGHIVPAIATGNTVIFKPSEKSPGTGLLMAEAFHEAGLPSGVFNLVQGEREVGRRLATHEGVDGVLFTGSYEVGLKIKQDTIHQHWKLLALEMGGKNSTIVLSDAALESAVHETLTSAFLTTGQRCSATSRVMVHRSLHDRFVEMMHEKSKKFIIGHPLDNPFMGPLIDADAVEKYLKFLGIAGRENCELIMRGKQYDAGYSGHYVTPSICLVADNAIDSVKKSVYQQTEIFGPNLAVYSFDDREEALRLANATQYGLAASVFTASSEQYEFMVERLRAGVINWNRPTIGASARLPFGGLKRSGNHFPTAMHATSYCTYPIASMEVAQPKMPTTFLPGLSW